MRAPDGRAVQVMAEDVADFEGRGFALDRASAAEPPAKPKRQKVTQAEPEEAI